MSLSDLFIEIGQLIKKYENNTYVESENIEKENVLYSINQVIELYPLLSKHILTNAINNGELEVTWIGNKRYFKLIDIDNYLKQKSGIITNNMPDIIQSWRKN